MFIFIRNLIIVIILNMANTSKSSNKKSTNTSKKRGRPPKNKTQTSNKNEINNGNYVESKPKKSKKKPKNNALKVSLISLTIVICIGALAYSGYYLYQNGYLDGIFNPSIKPDEDNKTDPTPDPTPEPTPDPDPTPTPSPDDEDDTIFDYDSPKVSTLISNSKYSIDSSSVFYQYNKDEIKKYYKNIDFTKDKETISLSLFNLLKTEQVKLNYDGSNSNFKMSYTWANYCLVDRNFVTSPLTQEEVDSNKWNRFVNMDILYQTGDYTFPSDGNTNNKLDREHILPKSYGFNGSNDAYKKMLAGTDLHNLRSSDHIGNSTGHNDRFYDDIVSKKEEGEYKIALSNDNITNTYYYDTKDENGNKIGFFEPAKEDKGDIARAVFYMVTRYKIYEELDSNGTEAPAIKLVENPHAKTSSTMVPSDTKENAAEFGILSTLKKWNEEDPVDEFEMTRNNLVYNIQNNRNPFVDYPSLVNLLF